MKRKLIALKKLAALTAFTSLFTVGGAIFGAEVFQPGSLPYGMSYEEWSAKWWQWSLAQSTNQIAYVGNPEICSGPANRVRFLAGGPYPTSSVRHVIVSDQVALLFPVLSIWVDNSGCPFTDLTGDQLLAEAESIWGSVTKTTCTIDGVAVSGMDVSTNSGYLVQSPSFSYTTAKKDNILAGIYGESCITGGTTIYPAVADGIFLMLEPLKRGKHVIHFEGIAGPASAPEVDVNVTYDITVVPE